MARNELIKALFEVMKNQLEVMAEHGDSEKALFRELCRADGEILNEYKAIFLDY